AFQALRSRLPLPFRLRFPRTPLDTAKDPRHDQLSCAAQPDLVEPVETTHPNRHWHGASGTATSPHSCPARPKSRVRLARLCPRLPDALVWCPVASEWLVASECLVAFDWPIRATIHQPVCRGMLVLRTAAYTAAASTAHRHSF